MTLPEFLYPDQGHFGDKNWCETCCKKILFDMQNSKVIGPYQIYLLVTDKEGEESVMEIKDDELLDLEALIRKWIEREVGNSFCLLEPFNSSNKIYGDYYAVIITDWRPKDSLVVWEGSYFFMEYCGE
jgi:hypothetical protein